VGHNAPFLANLTSNSRIKERSEIMQILIVPSGIQPIGMVKVSPTKLATGFTIALKAFQILFGGRDSMKSAVSRLASERPLGVLVIGKQAAQRNSLGRSELPGQRRGGTLWLFLIVVRLIFKDSTTGTSTIN
jgi:hypothetical protein